MASAACRNTEGGAGGIQGRNDFLGDNGAFADAADHNAALAGGQAINGLFKAIAELPLQLLDRRCLHPDRPQSRFPN